MARGQEPTPSAHADRTQLCEDIEVDRNPWLLSAYEGHGQGHIGRRCCVTVPDLHNVLPQMYDDDGHIRQSQRERLLIENHQHDMISGWDTFSP